MDLNMLKQLGLDEDKILDLVVERCCGELMETVSYDENGRGFNVSSRFKAAFQKRIQERIDEEIARISDEHVLPKITAMMENLTLQETNKWGEKKGQPVTFVEYLVARADDYMREEVNHLGKSKEESDYSWRKSSTRIAYLIHEHLQYNIKTAMELAMKKANESIAGGIKSAIEIKLKEVLDQMNRQKGNG